MVIADISIEFTCSREEMVRERIEDLHLERYQMTYEILSIAPGQIPKGHDECDLPEYRRLHGLEVPSKSDQCKSHVPEGCTSFVAHVRLHDGSDNAITRERILAIPFGDRDLGFSIDYIGKIA